MLELYGSAAGGMQPGRHGKVEPVVLARVDPPEQLDRLLATAAVITERLGAASRDTERLGAASREVRRLRR